MKTVIMGFCVAMLTATASFAQATPAPVLTPSPNVAPVPDDSAVETQRIRVIDEQNRLFSMLIMNDRAKAEATAAWWAEVWKALVEAKTGK